MTDLSECVIAAIPRRYVDPWLRYAKTYGTTAEDYDYRATGAAERSCNDAFDYATRAAVLRAVESPLRVLGDDEVVVSKETAQAWLEWMNGPSLLSAQSKALYDELAPQLAPPRPPVEVGQRRRGPDGCEVEVTAVGQTKALVFLAGIVPMHEFIQPLATVESWEVVDDE